MRSALLAIPLAFALGCGSKQEPVKEPPAPVKTNHEHGKEGPHGGALAEWGDHEYHVEFTVDHDAGQATAYVYDGEVKSPRPILAGQLTLVLKLTPSVTVTLSPAPQPGNPPGSASAFTGTHEALKTRREFAGTI